VVEAVAQGETVSALEEYRAECERWSKWGIPFEARPTDADKADAAIAELEAERDKVVSVLARALAAKLDQQNRAEQAEAELAEVQALRFDLQHKLDDARAALEAENVRQKVTIEAQSAIIKQADEALAARERMLRLFNELEYAARQAVHGDVDESAKGWMRMESVLGELADLRARAEEDTGEWACPPEVRAERGAK
jgi:vacuolar-type H+-ATPase subunit I/STV1